MFFGGGTKYREGRSQLLCLRTLRRMGGYMLYWFLDKPNQTIYKLYNFL